MKKHYIYSVILAISLIGCSFFNPFETNNDKDNTIIWRIADSPIIVDSLFNVKAHQTLIIESGVQVLFKSCELPYYYYHPTYDYAGTDSISDMMNTDNPQTGLLKINGRLDACGTAENPILFTRKNEGHWAAIFADTSSVVDIDYCNFEYFYGVGNVDLAPIRYGAIFFQNSSGLITHSKFYSSGPWSLSIRNDSNPIIRYNVSGI